MASTYSDLKFELIGTGDQSGTWGTTTNNNIGDAIEQALVGLGNPVFTSDANLTITLTNTVALQTARALVLNATSSGSLTATRELIVPTIEKQYIVQNNTTGAQSITVKTSGGTGITVPNGRKAHLYVDGTNVVQMFDFVDINGGTIDNAVIGGTTAAAGTFTTATATTGNITTVNATTVDATNVEVTNIKAKDGTASATIADSTGVMTIGSSVLTTADINGGTIDNTAIGGSTAAAGAFTTLSATGVTTVQAGTAALPAITTTGDTNTGIYFPAADTIAFTEGGAEAMRIDSSGNVGIGTTAPVTKLNLIDALSGGQLLVATNQTNATEKYGTFGTQHYTNAEEPALGMATQSNATDNIILVGGALSEFNAATQVRFYTAANNTTVTGTERMRIDSSGNVGIGTTTSLQKLSVAANSAGGTVGIEIRNADGVTTANNTAALYLSATGGTGQASRIQSVFTGTPLTNHAQALAFYSVTTGSTPTEAMRIDSSGNVGIGTASPSTYGKFVVAGGDGNTQFNVGTNGVLRIAGYSSTYSGALLESVNTAQSAYLPIAINGSYAVVATGGTERARIDSSGNLLVGRTTQISSEKFGVEVSGSNQLGYLRSTATSGDPTLFRIASGVLSGSIGSGNFIYCEDGGSAKFYVQGNGGIANFSASNTNLSDRREKTNFAPAGEYLSKICSIPVQTFNFIDQNLEEDGDLTLGVVAQDVQAVAPELITETNWGTKEAPKMRLSIYQTDLQYALMKCIQEQQALITALTTRITALEST